MPVNPHVKGGSDVPVTDGGTGASAGAGALTNLGGLSTATHATTSHSGIPGVGDLTTAAHGSLDHSGIPGVGRSILGPWNDFQSAGNPLSLFTNPNYLVVVMPVAGTLETFIAHFVGGANASFQITVNGGVVSTSPETSTGTAHAIGIAVSVGDRVGINLLTYSVGGSAAYTASISITF